MISKSLRKAVVLLLLSIMSVISLAPYRMEVGNYQNLTITKGGNQYFFLNITDFKNGGPEGILSIESEKREVVTYAKIIDSADGNITEMMMPLNQDDANFHAKTMFKGMQELFTLRVTALHSFNCTSCFLLVTVKYEEDFASPESIPLYAHLLDTTKMKTLTDEFTSEEINARPGEMVLRSIYLTDPAKIFNYYINFRSNDTGTVVSMLSNGPQIPYNFEYVAGQSMGFYNYYFLEQADFKVRGNDTATFTLLIFGDGKKFTISGRSVKYDLNSYMPVMNEVTQEEGYKYHHFALKGSEVTRYIESFQLLSKKVYYGSPRFLVKYTNSSWEADITKEFEAMNETNSFNFTDETMPNFFPVNDTTNHILVKSICDDDCVFDLKLQEYDGKLNYDTEEIVYLNANSTIKFDYERTVFPNDVTFFVKVVSGEGKLKLSDNTTVALSAGLDMKGLISGNNTFSLDRYPVFSSSETSPLIVTFSYKYSYESLLGDEPCINMDQTKGVKMLVAKNFCAYKQISRRTATHVRDILVDYFGYYLNNEFYYQYDILIHDESSTKSFVDELYDHSFFSRAKIPYWTALRDNHDSKIDIPAILLSQNFKGTVYVVLKTLQSNKFSFNVYPQYTVLNLDALPSPSTNSDILTLYKLNSQEVDLTVNKELVEKFVKFDVNKCFGEFSHELTHDHNRREVFTKSGVSMLFNISEMHPEVSNINILVKPVNVTEDYFKINANSSLTNRTEVAFGYRYFNTQDVNSITLALKNDTVLFNVNGNKTEFNFQPYTENIDNFTVEYHFYIFNKTNFVEPNICQLMALQSTFSVTGFAANNTSLVKYTAELSNGDYVAIVAAKESKHLNVVLPYKSIEFSIKNDSGTSGHTGLIVAIVIILFVIAGAAAFFYFKNMKNKTADSQRGAINSSDKLLP